MVGKLFSKYNTSRLTDIFHRLQFWKCHLPVFVPARGVTVTVGLEEAWSRSMDPNADHPMEYRRHVSKCSIWKEEFLCHA